MAQSTVVDLPSAEHAGMLTAPRRARYGDWLALHLVLWCATGRSPTELAALLCGSRSRVSRVVRA